MYLGRTSVDVEVTLTRGGGGYLTMKPEPIGSTPSPLLNLLDIQSFNKKFTISFTTKINQLYEGCTIIGKVQKIHMLFTCALYLCFLCVTISKSL